MNCITRISRSRDDWRDKAKGRNKTIAILGKRLARRDFYIERLVADNRQLSQALAQEKAKSETLMAEKNQPVLLADAATIRALCVLLVVVAVVSFRSVPRILRLMAASRVAPIDWIPSFTSVINWTLRFGLAKLQAVEKCAEPWLAIIDCSIDVGVKKALVVLRVKLDALAKRGSALCLEDCQCIGVVVGESWIGENVEKALTAIFTVAGLPAAIIKDQGTDLSRGVKMWRKSAKATSVWVIDDIGHIVANALKASFANRKMFNDFVASMKSIGAKLRQSDLAYLTPPKIRTKGRFQSIMKLADWGVRMLGLLGGSGRQEEGSVADRLRKFMPKFGSYRTFLEHFSTTCEIATKVLALLKNEGLNQKSYRECREFIEQLPERSKVRRRLMDWLNKHLRIQSRLGIGQIPLAVSSDIIESLFGKFKVIIQRNPKAEFNQIILTIPSLCGIHDQLSVHNALATTSHKDLLRWQKENVYASDLKKRREFLSNPGPEIVRAATG